MTDKPAKFTLSDDEIETRPRFGRRAFLMGAIGTTTALAACETVPTGLTDADPTDGAGNGRGAPRVTGLTDSDSGPYADAAGNGRRGTTSGYTDYDSGALADAGGNGRGPRRNYPSGLTDGDVGSTADAANYGRGG